MATLYTAYFDESGTHDGAEVTVVGGFVAEPDKWEQFSKVWQVALDDYGLEYFHMSEFESRQGPHATWANAERNELLNRFLDIIHEYVLLSVGIIIPMRSFDQLLSAKAKAICGNAYGLAAIGCWRKLGDAAQDPSGDAVLAYVMEAGANGGGALKNIFSAESKDADWRNRNRIESVEFRDKRLFLPVQAADRLVYELYKHGLRQFGTETRGERYPLRQLRRSPWKWNYLGNDELNRINEYLTGLQ